MSGLERPVSPHLRVGALVAIATLVIDQASKLWLLYVFDLARRGAVRVDRKAGGRQTAGQRRQFSQDGIGAVEGLDIPAQRQHVAPVAVGMEQGFQRAVVRLRQRLLELAKPIVGGYRTIVRPVEHARFLSAAVYAAFPCSAKPIPIRDGAERAGGDAAYPDKDRISP